MKKMLCIVLAIMTALAVMGCGNGNKNQNAGGKTERDILETGQSISETEAELEKEFVQESTEQEKEELKMKIQVGDTVFTAVLADNSSVDALKELMSEGPLTLKMSDYAGMEKGADLGVTLPQNNVQMNTQAGDIILYQGRTFVIYYDTNSWSLTPIGKIEDVNAEELKETLGSGDVMVTISME